MNWMKGALVALLFCAGSFWAGIQYQETRNAEQVAKQAQAQLAQYHKEAIAAVIEAEAKNEQIGAVLAVQGKKLDMAKGQIVETIKAEVSATKDANNVETRIYTEAAYCPSVPSASDFRLSIHAVRMLDAYRDLAEASDPAAASDDKSAATSNIGITELVEDSLQITKQYKELAVRHNALVDYITEQQKEQNK